MGGWGRATANDPIPSSWNHGPCIDFALKKKQILPTEQSQPWSIAIVSPQMVMLKNVNHIVGSM